MCTVHWPWMFSSWNSWTIICNIHRHSKQGQWQQMFDSFPVFRARSLEWMFVRLSVCLSQTGMHCDHTVHVSADLSLWLDSPMFRAPWRQSLSTYSQLSFQSSTWMRGVVWMCTWTTITSSASRAVSAVVELLVNVTCIYRSVQWL